MSVSDDEKRAILAFVDQVIPDPVGGQKEVWLVGSRAQGTARPDSDWDVLVFTPDAPAGYDKLFCCTQVEEIEPGFLIELVVAHPSHKTDPRRYMQGYREFGIPLRGGVDVR